MSYFRKTEELLEKLIDDVDFIYQNLRDIQGWDSEMYKAYMLAELDMKYLENRALKYRVNMQKQAKNPDLQLYGSSMLKRLERFLDNMDTLWEAWTERVEPYATQHVKNYVDKKEIEQLEEQSKVQKELEEAIQAGREQTQLEVEKRDLIYMNMQKDDLEKLEQEIVKEGILQNKTAFVNDLCKWFDYSRLYLNEYKYYGNDYVINLAINIMKDDEGNVAADSMLNCLSHVSKLFSNIYKYPSSKENGLAYRLLREDNHSFKTDFPCLWGTRILLLATGYMPYVGLDGMQSLSQILRCTDSNYAAQLSELRIQYSDSLITGVIWHSVEPSVINYPKWLLWRTQYLNFSRNLDNYIYAITDSKEVVSGINRISTTDSTSNITQNITENITQNITENITQNTTENEYILENITQNITENEYNGFLISDTCLKPMEIIKNMNKENIGLKLSRELRIQQIQTSK